MSAPARARPAAPRRGAGTAAPAVPDVVAMATFTSISMISSSSSSTTVIISLIITTISSSSSSSSSVRIISSSIIITPRGGRAAPARGGAAAPRAPLRAYNTIYYHIAYYSV